MKTVIQLILCRQKNSCATLLRLSRRSGVSTRHFDSEQSTTNVPDVAGSGTSHFGVRIDQDVKRRTSLEHTRRDVSVLLAALPAIAAGQTGSTLPSKTFRHEDLPVKNNGENASRAILNGKTHTGFPVEMHETELGPGLAPHAPHHHAHEEMVMVREGTLEVTISGKSSTLGPGSVAYVASNEEHGWKNVGTTRAKYFVLA